MEKIIMRPQVKNRIEASLMLKENHETWFNRFCKISPIVSVTLEHVKFDERT